MLCTSFLFWINLPLSSDFHQYLLEAGWAAEGKVIGVTQPRRVAAISVSALLTLLQRSLVHTHTLKDTFLLLNWLFFSSDR